MKIHEFTHFYVRRSKKCVYLSKNLITFVDRPRKNETLKMFIISHKVLLLFTTLRQVNLINNKNNDCNEYNITYIVLHDIIFFLQYNIIYNMLFL